MKPPGSNASNNSTSPKHGPASPITQLTPKRVRVSPAPPQPSTPKPDYNAVCRWISQCKAYEALTSTVAPLTRAQRVFLTKLGTLNLSTVGSSLKPLVSLTDWVNIMQSKLSPAATSPIKLRLMCGQYAATLDLRMAAT